jgi:hypothetical protein
MHSGGDLCIDFACDVHSEGTRVESQSGNKSILIEVLYGFPQTLREILKQYLREEVTGSFQIFSNSLLTSHPSFLSMLHNLSTDIIAR